MFWKPRNQNRNYPLDVNGDVAHTRFAKSVGVYPTPPVIGCITGFMPLQDMFVLRSAYGKAPSGPNVTTSPLNLQWQMTIPELTKAATNGL